MRLAIVGSRSFPTVPLWIEAEALIVRNIHIYRQDIEEIISGGAEGVDSLAEKWADYYSIPKLVHLPENRRWAPDGFKDRNIKIAEDCTHLLCIRYEHSKTNGSGWTADYAESIGKVVRRYDLE